MYNNCIGHFQFVSASSVTSQYFCNYFNLLLYIVGDGTSCISCYFSKSHHILACSHPLSHLHFLLTTTTHEGRSNRVNTTPSQLCLRCLNTTATPFESHILFKARALGSTLVQPKGDWVISETHSPRLHLRASTPEHREILRYMYF